jgi:hypothetical protein
VTARGTSLIRIGLNVLGNGGAQMTLRLSGAGLVGVECGLPGESTPQLTITAAELCRALAGHVAATDLTTAWECCSDEQALELTSLLLQALNPEAAAITI